MIKKLLSKLNQALNSEDVTEAQKVIDKISKRPQQAEVYLDIAKFCIYANYWLPVEAHFNKACVEKPDLGLQVVRWLDDDPLLSNHKKAMQLIEVAEAYNPNNLVVQSVKGVVLNRMEKFQEAIPVFESILERDQSGERHYHALLGLGEAYFKTNRYHDVIAASTLASQLKPDQDEPLFQMGLSYVAVENLTEGVRCLAKAIEINPDHLGAHINLAHVMLKVGMFDEGWSYSRNGNNGGLELPDQAHVVAELNAETYKDYRKVEGSNDGRLGSHVHAHVWVGGNMSKGDSPLDPLFYLHHCNIDRLWAIWQVNNADKPQYDETTVISSDSRAPRAPYVGLDEKMPEATSPWQNQPGFSGATPKQMLDHKELGFFEPKGGYGYDRDTALESAWQQAHGTELITEISQ